jgi:hypothetical protein
MRPQKPAGQACLIRASSCGGCLAGGGAPKSLRPAGAVLQGFSGEERAPHLDWLTVACQTGYYDYQHLVRDCKEFAGTTPARLVEEENGSPASVLGVTLQYY